MIFIFPPLAAGYWWAVRHSGVIERVGWVILGSVAAALWAWEITYPVTEGTTRSSWVVAGGAAMIMAALLVVGTRYRVTRQASMH
jgi:hypothetical protein